jgi:hypothetical protein
MPTTHEQQAAVIPLPHPARVAGQIVRLILATNSEDDPGDRMGIARSVVEVSWRNGGLHKRYGPGVGGVQARDGSWTLAPVCLECCWVGEVTSDEDAAGAAAASHRC